MRGLFRPIQAAVRACVHGRTIALALALALTTSLARDAQASVRGTQCAAEDKAKRSKKALDIAFKIYTAAAATCATACYAPTTVGVSGPLCTAGTFGGIGYDIYQSIEISKDPSGLMGLVFGITMGGLDGGVGTTMEILGGAGGAAAPAAAPAAPNALSPGMKGGGKLPFNELDKVGENGAQQGGQNAAQQNADKAKEQAQAYCKSALMNALQAVFKLMARKSAASAAGEAKEACEAEADGGTRMLFGSGGSGSGSDATATITPLGVQPGADRPSRGGGGGDDCGEGIPKSLKTFQSCATAADPELGKFFTPEAQQDFKDITGKDLGELARAQPSEGGFAEGLAATLAAAGKPVDNEGARALEAYLANEISKSPNSMYSGGGGGGGRSKGNDALNPKQLMKEMMAALGAGNKEEEEKRRQASALVFGATREPANDLSSRRDISIFDRVGRRYRESIERVLP